MKIIIDKNTNKILRYGAEVIANEDEYMIERDVDLSVWVDYDIIYNKLRETFERWSSKKLKNFETRIDKLENKD